MAGEWCFPPLLDPYQVRSNSADLSFDLEVDGILENPAALRPKPELQRAGRNTLLLWPAA